MMLEQELSKILGGYFLQITDTAIITIENQKITYLNEAAVKLFGRPANVLFGADIASLISEENRNPFVEKLNNTHERTDYFQIKVLDEKNNIIELRARLVPLILNDRRIVMMEAYNEEVVITLKKKNQALEDKIMHLSPLDLETHLPSLILLNDRIEQAILRALREARGNLDNIQSYLTVVVGNIDGLNEIYQQCGSEGRRYALDVLISRFKSSIRSVDTLAKTPDDSFYFLFENIRDKQNIQIITNRLQNCVNVPILYKNQSLNLKMSLGVSIYPDNGTSAVSLIKWARLNPIAGQPETTSNTVSQ
ncbi:MAG: diguanylate cyclase [Alphaproteobacteria bacterium]|nr:diguanylate cyclase [Alphaproteobacteria bacterium]